MHENEDDCREPEQYPCGGEDEGRPWVKRGVLAAREGLFDALLTEVAVSDERGANDREGNADDLEGPVRATG